MLLSWTLLCLCALYELFILKILLLLFLHFEKSELKKIIFSTFNLSLDKESEFLIDLIDLEKIKINYIDK